VIARDFDRSRVQIDDFGPDVELAYELLDPLPVPFQLAVDLWVAGTERIRNRPCARAIAARESRFSSAPSLSLPMY
jgi:hypothetical protein